jgi:hypothetical protein
MPAERMAEDMNSHTRHSESFRHNVGIRELSRLSQQMAFVGREQDMLQTAVISAVSHM